MRRTSPDEEAAESSGEDEESDIPTTATASGLMNGTAAVQPSRSRLGQEALKAVNQQVRLCTWTMPLDLLFGPSTLPVAPVWPAHEAFEQDCLTCSQPSTPL